MPIDVYNEQTMSQHYKTNQNDNINKNYENQVQQANFLP